MELDELKLAWQQLDRRLEQQQSLTLQQLRDSRLTKAQHVLSPLYWGQVLQMVCGVLVILLAVSYWTAQWHMHHRLLFGLIVHVYGVLMVVMGGIVVGRISQIDYTAPVTAIQQQLARLRCFYIFSGMILGLSWWLLWIPFMVVVFGLLGADMPANAPEANYLWIYLNMAFGVAGLLATWWFHRWSHHPSRPLLAQWIDDGAAGSSLTKARRILEEVARFGQE